MAKKIALILAAVLLFAVLLTACAKPEEKIVGAWKSRSNILGVVTETTYNFNKDGTGKKTIVVPLEFTYTIGEETLRITTNPLGLGIETTDSYEYTFEGDTLTLKSDSETIVLEKIK